jgi:hypothetical protein
MKQTLLTGWDFMRVVRLGLGVFVGVQAFQLHDMPLGFMALFLLFQAVTNTGCGSVNGCAAPTSKSFKNSTEDIKFEEIK